MVNTHRTVAISILIMGIFGILVGNADAESSSTAWDCEDLDGANGWLGYTDGDSGWAAACYLNMCENPERFTDECYGGNASILHWFIKTFERALGSLFG